MLSPWLTCLSVTSVLGFLLAFALATSPWRLPPNIESIRCRAMAQVVYILYTVELAIKQNQIFLKVKTIEAKEIFSSLMLKAAIFSWPAHH